MNDTRTTKKNLLLVDGSSYLYRAFHAMPDLRAVPGEPSSAPTGAIRGMINMLQSLRKDFPADFAACVFDARGPTFRDALYPEYKAHRSPMPDDLRAQIEPIHEVVRLMGWQVLAVPGVEADDVIGTLAVTAAAQGVEVIVSSGDKDLAQLVNSHITIIDTMNGKRRDVAGVEAEFGVPPALMVDYQTLVGDVIDNVPGVPKVGPKTAAKWLQQYGSLDGVVAHADAITGAVGENLRKSLDWLPLGRQLLTIKTDCDLSGWVNDLPALTALASGSMNFEALFVFYEKYGFKGLARAIAARAPMDRHGLQPRDDESGQLASSLRAQRGNPLSEPGLFDEPDQTVSQPRSSVTVVAYETLLTWQAL
ncbi:MAG: 5'-3' exonuclease H3TH domain-containing protein, partial [Comamonadaceae bacterium]